MAKHNCWWKMFCIPWWRVPWVLVTFVYFVLDINPSRTITTSTQARNVLSNLQVCRQENCLDCAYSFYGLGLLWRIHHLPWQRYIKWINTNTFQQLVILKQYSDCLLKQHHYLTVAFYTKMTGFDWLTSFAPIVAFLLICLIVVRFLEAIKK